MENNINKEDVDVIIKFLKKIKKEYLLNQKKLKNLKLNGLNG